MDQTHLVSDDVKMEVGLQIYHIKAHFINHSATYSFVAMILDPFKSDLGSGSNLGFSISSFVILMNQVILITLMASILAFFLTVGFSS
jgi:hypothetical protein